MNIPVTRRLRAVLDNTKRSATVISACLLGSGRSRRRDIPEDLLTVMLLHCMLSVMRDALRFRSNSTLTVYQRSGLLRLMGCK